ncbi:MAG TPA: ABC transporter permease [Syntrophobacteraceae bacterium]|nr:ABC transporter permease [Syntrophobacteraceae bacterium]
MTTYISRRVIQGFLVMLGVTFICFVIFRFTGDPAIIIAGQDATPAQVEEVRQAYGLDKPFYIQYVLWLSHAARGDFGRSFISKVPALGLILERLPATVELATTAVLLALSLGVFLGVLVSIRPRSWLSRLIMMSSLAGISTPTFLIGTLLIMVFAVELGILPPFGRGETVLLLHYWPTSFLTLSGLSHLVLPTLTLVGYQLAVLLRLTRAGMREVLGEEYIKTAWAKGLSRKRVVFKHALRNVLIPVVTMSGLMLGEILVFSIVTETIYQWPGMGNLLLTSIYEYDQPVIVTYIMLASFIILTINVGVDILYALLNPKIRYD